MLQLTIATFEENLLGDTSAPIWHKYAVAIRKKSENSRSLSASPIELRILNVKAMITVASIQRKVEQIQTASVKAKR